MTNEFSKLNHQAPYPCQTLPLYDHGPKYKDFPLGGIDRSLFGYNNEYTIKNTTGFIIHVFSLNGDYLTSIPPYVQGVGAGQNFNFVTNIGVQVYFRSCLGSQITRGKKPPDEQKFYSRNFTIEELSTAPTYIPQAQIILAFEDQRYSIMTFSDSINLILNGKARTKDGRVLPVPFCAYVNLAGIEKKPEHLYYCVNKTTYFRVPVIQVNYLAPGVIFSKFELIEKNNTVSTHGLNTTYDDLMSEEGGGVAYCHCETGDVVHFSFDIELLKLYLSDTGNLDDEEREINRDIPILLSEEDCARRIKAATASLRQENVKLSEELNRVTCDRDQILKDKADAEKLADRAQSPGSYRKKKAEQEHERKDKKIKSRLSHIMDIVKIIGAVGTICVALKDPLIALYKWVKHSVLKTPVEQPA